MSYRILSTERHFAERDRPFPLFICLCGPTASGKSTIARQVIAQTPDLSPSISTTTRGPRAEEKDGYDYHFVTREEFERRVIGGVLLEHAEFSGNFYGTGRENIERAREERRDLISDIDVNGVQALKIALRGQVVTIFVVPSSLSALEARLRSRGAENEVEMRRRLARALDEIEILERPGFADYRVVNVSVEQAVEDVAAIIQAERLRIG